MDVSFGTVLCWVVGVAVVLIVIGMADGGED
jgi:hypothetical protein